MKGDDRGDDILLQWRRNGGLGYTHTHSASMIDCLFIVYAAKQLTLPAYELNQPNTHLSL